MLQLEGKPVARILYDEIHRELPRFASLRGRAPRLDVVWIGEDAASGVYISKKERAAHDLGFASKTHRFSDAIARSEPERIKAFIHDLNGDENVDAILVQRPTPISESELVGWVTPSKDVDGFHPENVGKWVLGLEAGGCTPCTPAGVMRILSHYKINTQGRRACVIGRSSTVGRPMEALLTRSGATVTLCHSKTADLRRHTRDAELVVVAAGVPRLVGWEDFSPGTVIVDVGIHRLADGKLIGDVRRENIDSVASAITPVPGGVGPLTIAQLLQNTLRLAIRAAENKGASK